MTRLLTWVAALSLLLPVLLVTAQDTPTSIALNQKYEPFEIKQRHTFAYYKLPIPQNTYSANKDLIVKVVPQDYESDPDIFISKNNTNPNSTQNSEWQCSAYGKDTCAIHHKNISANDVFYIGVLCPSTSCKFILSAFLTDEFWLEDGVDFQIYLDKNDARVFKFKVPTESNIGAQNNQSITIKASAYRQNIHDFVLTAKINAEQDNSTLASTDWKSKKGIAAWKQGQVIRLGYSDFKNKWCSGCEIDILLDVVDSGHYHIMAQTNDATPLLTNAVQMDDIVRYHEKQCYKYYVKEEKTDLQIALTTYSGQIDVRLNAKTIPDKWDDFRLKRNNTYDTIIDIHPWLRQHIAQAPKGLYFICVQGALTSTYTIKVREFYQDQRHTTLEDGYSESFFLASNDMHVHLYHVPKLDYSDEDILIQVDLAVRRGQRPILAGRMCLNTDTEQCRKDVSKELVATNQFTRGKDTGQVIKLTMNHNESLCASQLNGNCFYVIAIVNPTQNYTFYQATAYHSQNNHILLQESQAYLDSVEDKRFKYYKYSLIDDHNVQNVSFQLSPLHGDSDLYVSRINQFPNKTHNEKMSVRVGGGVDQISFSAKDSTENLTLASTYYVGVFGYQYATYSLLAHSTHPGDHHSDSDHSMSHLVEGVSFEYTIPKRTETFQGCFDVSIVDDDDRQIIFDFYNTRNEVDVYVKHGSMPDKNNHDFKAHEGGNYITRDQRHYHKDGTYFIRVYPKTHEWDMKPLQRFSFRMQYRYENTIGTVNSRNAVNLGIWPHTFNYLQHFVAEVDTDLDIILQGDAHTEIFVSFHAKNKYPTEQNNDLTTMTQLSSSFSKGKSMYLSYQTLQYLNPACVDLGYAENEACVIYIGVECRQNTDCNVKLSVEYQSDRPKRIVPGSPRHSQVEANRYSYYYLTVEKSRLTDIYAVLNPIMGDVDMFVSLQRDNAYRYDWDLPTAKNYHSRSKLKLKSEMIQLTKKDLELCFLPNSTDNDECIIIYGIQSKNAPDNTTQSYFSLIVYKDVTQINDEVPIMGYVREKEFNYFLYDAKCSNCSIIFSLSSSTNGKPDLFIVKGDRLPSLNDYDVKKSTIQSEVITIDMNSDFIKNNNTSTMEGYYIIGVYGYQNTTFILTVISQDQPVMSLSEGLSIRHQQNSFQTTYFQFFSWQQNKDVEISVSVLQGTVDLYVSTFMSNHSQQNYIERLPKTKSKALWRTEGINAVNQVEGKEVVILQEDRNFCTDCYYLIGVNTGDQKARYSILVRSIEAEKNYTNLIKLGEVKQVKFTKQGEHKIFQFMLDHKENAQVIPTTLSGAVSMTVGFEESSEGAFVSQNNNNHIQISGENLKTETNYYIVMQCLTNQAEITLTVHQQQTVYTLHDGIPQLVRFLDYQDASKYLVFDVPGGNSTIKFNVKSKTKDFFPLLYYRMFKEQEANDKIIFPPSEMVPYDSLKEQAWDKDMYLLKHTVEILNAQEDAAIAVSLVYNKRDNNKSSFAENEKTLADVIVTMSYSQILKIAEGEDYLGELKHGVNDFALFKIDPPADKLVYIEFSQCLGLTTYSVISDPNKFDAKVQLTKKEVMGKEITIVKNLVGNHYILIESVDLGSQSASKKEFLLKFKYIVDDKKQEALLQGHTYMSANGGAIQYEYLPDKKGGIKLQWGKLYHMNEYGDTPAVVDGVRYQLVTSSDSAARLDSVCAANRNADVFKIMDSPQSNTEFIFNSLKPGEELYFNVIALKEDEQITVPYQPVTLISMTPKNAYGGIWLILLLSALFIIFGILAFVFYCRGKKLEQKLEIELRDITSADTGDNQVYRRVKPQGVGATANGNYNNFTDERSNVDNL